MKIEKRKAYKGEREREKKGLKREEERRKTYRGRYTKEKEKRRTI